MTASKSDPAACSLRELAEATVSGWPPLTAEQRADVAALLRGFDTDAAGSGPGRAPLRRSPTTAALVLARPTEGRQRAGQPNTRGPVVPAPRTPGLRTGDVVRLNRSFSPQFSLQPILFRVVRSEPASVVDGWAWIEGYQLDAFGGEVRWRKIFVRVNALI